MIGMLLILCFSDTEVGLTFGVGLSISLIATVWNFMFNYAFDKSLPSPRNPQTGFAHIPHLHLKAAC